MCLSACVAWSGPINQSNASDSIDAHHCTRLQPAPPSPLAFTTTQALVVEEDPKEEARSPASSDATEPLDGSLNLSGASSTTVVHSALDSGLSSSSPVVDSPLEQELVATSAAQQQELMAPFLTAPMEEIPQENVRTTCCRLFYLPILQTPSTHYLSASSI
jgi:hypothetical protein